MDFSRRFSKGAALFEPALIVLGLVIFVLAAAFSEKEKTEQSELDSPLEQKARDILVTLSLEDKVGEMTQLTLDMLCVGEPYNLEEPIRLDPAKVDKVLLEHRVGSILNAPGHTIPVEKWREFIGVIQQKATEEKESGVPVLYGVDAIHGTNYTDGATLFPQQIGTAAGWDLEMARKVAEITAYETRASGIPWTFSPVLDLGRDARWPRLWETFGEDVHLASEMGRAMVDGYENNPAGLEVASCMKHFLGYSVTLSGRDRTQAWVPDRELRQYFLPSFKAAIDAGAKTIMINSGEMNGTPVHINPKILKDLLRDELGFTGLAVSDWEDIKYLYTRHHVAEDYKDAIAMAVNAGIDMSMVPTDLDFPVLLKELVEEGRVPMERIDEAVLRIITLKLELDLWNYPLGKHENFDEFASKESAQVSFEAAHGALVLLRNNESVLPLNSNQKILLAGPTAHSLNALNGGWTHTWQGTDPKFNTPGKPTIYEALQSRLTNGQLTFVPATSIDQVIDLEKFKSEAEKNDVLVICLGEMPYTEKPGDIPDLDLPAAQRQLLQAAGETGKPVVLILVEGRPRTFPAEEAHADAVMMALLPGNEGGRAVASVLMGESNPRGRLPITYPRHSNERMNYDHKNTDRLHANFSWEGFNPLFHFGAGMDYTTFNYSDLSISSNELGAGDKLRVSVRVKNTGDRTGHEVVQLYIHDKVASITPANRKLKAFQKIKLAAGEEKALSFELDMDDLAFYNADSEWVAEAGGFELMIANLKTEFQLLEDYNPNE